MATRTRLGRRDWIDAAADMVAERGIGAVAVEPLAQRLGTTKGSFYWHFTNRDELIAAMLDTWTAEHTELIISRVAQVPDPAQRLTRLFDDVFVLARDARFELGLLASADDPQVSRCLRTVTRRRVEFLTECFAEQGCDPGDAHRRALLAYTAYLGVVQVQRITGGRMLPVADRAAYLDFLRTELITLPRQSPSATRPVDDGRNVGSPV